MLLDAQLKRSESVDGCLGELRTSERGEMVGYP